MERSQRIGVVIPVGNDIKYLPAELGRFIIELASLQPGTTLVLSPFRRIEVRHDAAALPYKLHKFVIWSHLWTPLPYTASPETFATGTNALSTL
jgi:hypothetical protein